MKLLFASLLVLSTATPLVLFTATPAFAYKVVAIEKMSSPQAQSVLKAAQGIGEGAKVYAYKVKYYFPESREPGDLDDIYFFDDRAKEAVAADYPSWGEAKGYNIAIGGPSRFDFFRRELASDPFYLNHEPYLDAMIAGLQSGQLTTFWLSRTLQPRGLVAYGAIDYQNMEWVYVVTTQKD